MVGKGLAVRVLFSGSRAACIQAALRQTQDLSSVYRWRKEVPCVSGMWENERVKLSPAT